MSIVKNIMTTEVITVYPDATVQDVAKVLADNKISGIPVVNVNHEVIGVVSEQDLVVRNKELKVPTFADILGGIIYVGDTKKYDEELKKATAVMVRDLMSSDVICVHEEDRIEKVATLMVDKKINRVPVLNHEGKLEGIVTRADLVRWMSKQG